MRTRRADSYTNRDRSEGPGAGAPGKRAATESIQRKASRPPATLVAAQATSVAAPALAHDDPFDFRFLPLDARVPIQRRADAAAPSDPETVTRIAHGGLGSGAELPHRAQLEAGFGLDLSTVRAHTGSSAAQASRAIGAEAYTIGADVAFASASPGPELVAHEVAHVIQQRAGAGPATGVGEAGDAFEHEADTAAAAVASGGRSVLASRYAPAGAAGALQRRAVQRYESSEHAATGDGMQYPVAITAIELPNGAHATRGELIALGDFYQDYDAIARAPREETEALVGIIRWEGIWRLAMRQKHLAPQGGGATTDATRPDGDLHNAAEPDDTGVFGGEAEHHGIAELLTWDDAAWQTRIGDQTLRTKAQELHAQFSPSWQFFGVSVPLQTFSENMLTLAQMKLNLGRRRFRNANNTLGTPQTGDLAATTNPRVADPGHLGGDFFDLGSNNVSHFAITNWSTWEHYHRQVCLLVKSNPDDAAMPTRAAIEDAWGCHYLTDMFASGHLVDKQALMTSATDMMVGMSQRKGLSKPGAERHGVLTEMLEESLQVAFREPAVYDAWCAGARNALDQGLCRPDEVELMLSVPIGDRTAHGNSVVGQLVATIMGMPWRNNEDARLPGGGEREAYGPPPQVQGQGDYHLGIGNLAALTVHNALNAIGITAENDAGDVWRMQGDGHLSAATQAIAQKAVDESARQARAGDFNPDAVKRFTPRRGTIDPSWVITYYASRSDFHADPAKMATLMAAVERARTPIPLTDDAAGTVSPILRDICQAIMEVEFCAPPREFQGIAADAAANTKLGTASMSDTGVNTGFLRGFLIDNLPRMVPAAYAATSAGDLPSAALEVYRPRGADGNFLPTAANDFWWDRTTSTVHFKVNVTGCPPGPYTLGVHVHDHDGNMDHLPSGPRRPEQAPHDADERIVPDDERTRLVPVAVRITVPDGASAAENGRTYVDASFALTGNLAHDEHYVRVFADPRCTMPIGVSSPRGSRETSNPMPAAPAPRATGPDANPAPDFYPAGGVDRGAFAWSDNQVQFRLVDTAPPTAPATAPIRAWVKQFDCDADYDYDESGRELTDSALSGRNDDPLVGGPTMIEARRELVDGHAVTAQVAFATVDNPNDTYVIVYADAACTQPLARSPVQGTDRAAPVVGEGPATTPFFASGSRTGRLAAVGSVTYTKNPRTPADLRRLMPTTFLGPFTVPVHARSVGEWTAFFSDGTATDDDDGMHDVFAFMSLALGRQAPAAALVGDAESERPFARYTISGRAPTEDESIDCVVGLVNAGGECRFAHGYAHAVIDDFMTRFTPQAIVRNSQGGRQMQRGDVEKVAGVNDSMRYLGDSNEILIASGVGTAAGAAMQVLDFALHPDRQDGQPNRVNLMRNGALVCRGALDAIERHDAMNATGMMTTFAVAAAAVGPLAGTLTVATEIVASGIATAVQGWFGQLMSLSPEQRRRDLKDRFRAQIEPYARARGIDINTTGTLLNTFDNALDY